MRNAEWRSAKFWNNLGVKGHCPLRSAEAEPLRLDGSRAHRALQPY